MLKLAAQDRVDCVPQVHHEAEELHGPRRHARRQEAGGAVVCWLIVPSAATRDTF